ncbi:MAG: divalent-cation tolerance protein CutA [Methanomicrobiaceae archaeon]|nr:divalent-cation tolerance protein CutA [Methanomicrobiaceae archaeon]
MLIIKTTKDSFNSLKDLILLNHSYSLPEIIALSVTSGFDDFLAWIREKCSIVEKCS